MMRIFLKCLHFSPTISLLILQLLHTYGSKEYWLDVSGNSGYITSPNFPGNYPRSTSCFWNITVDSPYALNLTLRALDLEKTSSCSADFVQVRISSNQKWSDQTRHCSDATISILSSSGWAQVRFVSDSQNEFTGFNMTWSGVQRIVHTSDISIDLKPSPTVNEMCSGVPAVYDTVTISSCTNALSSGFPGRSSTSLLLESTNCICETAASSFYHSLSNSTPSSHTKPQASIHGSLLDTALASNFASLKTSPSKPLLTNYLLTSWLQSSGTYSSISWNIPRSLDVSIFSKYTFNSRETRWTIDGLHPSSKYSPSLYNALSATVPLQSASIYDSSLRGTLQTNDALKFSTHAVNPKQPPRTTNGWQPSGGLSSDIHGIDTEAKYSDATSLIQTSNALTVSMGIPRSSQISHDCRSETKSDSPRSSMVNILLWAVLGVFLLIGTVFGLMLFKEIKSNRIDVGGNVTQTTSQ